MVNYAEKLDKAKTRLNLYYTQEEKMLQNGVQSYGLGQRNLTRYQLDLANIKATIKELENEIDYLERRLCGKSKNRSFSVVPTDW